MEQFIFFAILIHFFLFSKMSYAMEKLTFAKFLIFDEMNA